MASIYKKKGLYYIRFYEKLGNTRKQKVFSLKTPHKKEAEKWFIIKSWGLS